MTGRRNGPGARPDTWMPIYWGDYARDTGHLGNAEHGSYLMLIKHYWCTGGPLPDDDNQLWRIACCDGKPKWKSLRPTLEKFFVVENGFWRHKRIDRELAEARERTENRRNAGKKGAEQKWQTPGNASSNGNGAAMAMSTEPNGNAIDVPSLARWQNDGQSQSQSQKKENSRQAEENNPPRARARDGEEENLVVAVIAAFDEARAQAFGEEARRAWPRNTDRATAKAWLDAGLSVDELRAMFQAVHRKLAGNGYAPPEHLRYHQTDVDRLLRARARSPNNEPGAKAADAEDAAWRGRLKLYRDQDLWFESWGPRPGEPGCFVPADLLENQLTEKGDSSGSHRA